MMVRTVSDTLIVASITYSILLSSVLSESEPPHVANGTVPNSSIVFSAPLARLVIVSVQVATPLDPSFISTSTFVMPSLVLAGVYLKTGAYPVSVHVTVPPGLATSPVCAETTTTADNARTSANIIFNFSLQTSIDSVTFLPVALLPNVPLVPLPCTFY